jgi:hypothetical protein
MCLFDFTTLRLCRMVLQGLCQAVAGSWCPAVLKSTAAVFAFACSMLLSNITAAKQQQRGSRWIPGAVLPALGHIL